MSDAPEEPPAPSSRRRRISAALVLAVLSQLLSVAVQVGLPAVLLRRWSEAAYALVIAVQSLAASLAATDAGVQLVLLTKLNELTALGEHKRARGLAFATFRLLGVSILLGLLLLAAFVPLFSRRLFDTLAPAAGIGTSSLVLALVLNALAAASSVLLGGWSTAVETSRGQYHRVPLLGLLRSALSAGSVLLCAQLRGSPALALGLSACLALAVDLGRFSLSVGYLRGEREAIAFKELLRILASAPIAAASNAVTGGLLPASVSLLHPEHAGASFPGRTLANSARLVTSALLNTAFAPMQPRLLQLRSEPEKCLRFTTLLTDAFAALHAGSIAGVVLVAPFFVPRWLPAQAPTMLHALPVFLVDQLFAVLVIPSTLVHLAAGRVGLVGVASILAGFLSVLAAALLMPSLGAFGFGLSISLGTALAAAPLLLWTEHRDWRAQGVRLDLRGRLTFAALAALSVGASAFTPRLSPLVALAVGLFALYRLGVLYRSLRSFA